MSGNGKPLHCQAYSHFISPQRFIKLQPVAKSWQGRLPVHGDVFFFQWSPMPLINEASSVHPYPTLLTLSPFLPVLLSDIHFLKCSKQILRAHVCGTPAYACVRICVQERVCMCKRIVFSCDCVLVRWDVILESLWQLHYLGGVSLSAFTCFLSLGPLSHSNIYLLPWHTLSNPFCLSVSELGLL